MGRYRRLGADPPFGDSRRGHGISMEGYYWRLSDPASGRVIIALCGVCQSPDGPWAGVAVAAHPQGLLREGFASSAVAEPGRYGVRAADLLEAGQGRLDVDLGPDVAIHAQLTERTPWPRAAYGALGPAHWIPGLGQYWHPHLLDARAGGHATIGGEHVDLDGWHVYGEKNWGSGFPGRWWWGQAHGFDDQDVCVAFAGGRLPGAPLAATAVVVRIGDELIRMSPPTALVRATSSLSHWRVTGTGPRHRLELEGTAGADPFMLPVPIPAERRTEPGAAQHLAGELRVRLRRGRRLLYEGASPLAGLEHGDVAQSRASA